MLVLSRKENQIVIIGESIRVTVVRIERGNVRLGFEAPQGTPVHRLEVQQKLDRKGVR